MGIPSRVLLVLAALAALPASAQGRFQAGIGVATNGSVEGRFSNGTLKRDSKAAPSLFVGCRVMDLGSSDLSVTAEYQFQTNYGFSGDFWTGAYQSSYAAPGVQWTYHGAVDLGAGLQIRFESLSGSIQTVSDSTSYNRAWLNGYVGYTFQADWRAKPFVGLRLAGAVTRTDLPAPLTTSQGKKLLRAMDGDIDLALMGGVRF
jgi:hypothetical protein